mmetsp:Transcript_16540/g.40935  ORF Transcript_16540/g.40935 Transcript_16540/m.40935 type:complete len:252 (-) Transcript_16540:715-1470(-)
MGLRQSRLQLRKRARGLGLLLRVGGPLRDVRLQQRDPGRIGFDALPRLLLHLLELVLLLRDSALRLLLQFHHFLLQRRHLLRRIPRSLLGGGYGCLRLRGSARGRRTQLRCTLALRLRQLAVEPVHGRLQVTGFLRLLLDALAESSELLLRRGLNLRKPLLEFRFRGLSTGTNISISPIRRSCSTLGGRGDLCLQSAAFFCEFRDLSVPGFERFPRLRFYPLVLVVLLCKLRARPLFDFVDLRLPGRVRLG